MFSGEFRSHVHSGGERKLDKKRTYIAAAVLVVTGGLALIFGQSADPIECPPENTRWAGGPLGAIGKTCDKRGVNYD